MRSGVKKILCVQWPSVHKKTTVPKIFIGPLKNIDAVFWSLKFY